MGQRKAHELSGKPGVYVCSGQEKVLLASALLPEAFFEGNGMGWHIVRKRIGRAGSLKQRTKRQHEWDRIYGEDMWAVGYLIDGRFVLQEDAWESIYYCSYEEHFTQHPLDLEELITLAKRVRNPHAEATTSVDLQVPAIMEYLRRHHLSLQGEEMVDIGSWQGRASHAISVRLSPLQIKVVGNPRMTLEQFWQEEKCLAIWESEEEHAPTSEEL